MTAPAPPLLFLKHVTVLRGAREQRPALDDVTLQIAAGEHVCILGPNGCGKSTLIKTITRECYPIAREGSSISILGRERWDIFELRSKLGIISPDLLASCTTDATGRDVVLSGFFSSTRIFPHHHPDSENLARANEALARLGIAHLAERAVAAVSSGDTKRELAQSGLGILLVTHHVSEIIPEIERVVLLREGRVLADGRKSEILTAEHLSNLFGAAVRLAQHDGYFHLY